MKPPPPPLRIVSIPSFDLVWHPVALFAILMLMAVTAHFFVHRTGSAAHDPGVVEARDESVVVTPRRITNIAKARRLSLSQIGGAADPTGKDAVETALDTLDGDLAAMIRRMWAASGNARGTGSVRIEINPSNGALRVSANMNNGSPEFTAALDHLAEALRDQNMKLPAGWNGGAYEVSFDVSAP